MDTFHRDIQEIVYIIIHKSLMKDLNDEYTLKCLPNWNEYNNAFYGDTMGANFRFTDETHQKIHKIFLNGQCTFKRVGPLPKNY